MSERGSGGSTGRFAAGPDVAWHVRGLGSVRGLLLDLDGVLVRAGRPIAGAVEAMSLLARRGVPFRIVTNTSLVSRETLAEQCGSEGLAVSADEIVSAVSATAAWTAREYPGRPLFVITSADAKREFDGQRLLGPAEAAALARSLLPASGGHRSAEGFDSVAAVVIGDSPVDLSRENLDTAFRLVRAGARFVAMHRNPWWHTPDGPALDSGAFVVALEYALERKAFVIGKPSPAFFLEGVRSLLGQADASAAIASRASADIASRAALCDIAMVGDDVFSDVLAAQAVGVHGVLVLTGKHGLGDVERAARLRRGGGRPDLVADSLAALVAAID